MSMSAPYVSFIGHGAASLAPAGVFTGVTAHAFMFRANDGAMQALADEFLNAPARGRVRYRALSGRALATFMDYAKCTSSIDQIGWVPGRECALWVPLVEFDAGLPRLVMWSPYIYIDYTIGMLTGREVWGWSKVSARIAMPWDAGAAPEFCCSTTMFPTMRPDTRGEFGPLFKVRGGAGLQANAAALGAGDALEGFRAQLAGEAAEGFAAIQWPWSPAAVALKQVRDSADPALACYQAICDSPLEVTRIGPFGLLDASAFELEITTCESHRIVQDLLGRQPGAGSTVLPIEWAFRCEVDFQAVPGRVLAP